MDKPLGLLVLLRGYGRRGTLGRSIGSCKGRTSRVSNGGIYGKDDKDGDAWSQSVGTVLRWNSAFADFRFMDAIWDFFLVYTH